MAAGWSPRGWYALLSLKVMKGRSCRSSQVRANFYYSAGGKFVFLTAESGRAVEVI